MPPVTLERAYGGLRKGEIAAAYCLSGPADVLKDELVDAITDAVLEPAARDFNLDVRSAGDLDGEALHSLVETPPMLAERRVVVVRGLEQWRKNAKVWEVLLRYLERPSPTTVLVLLFAGDDSPDARVTRQTLHVEVGLLKPDQVTRWLQREAGRLGVTLADDAAAHLMASVGGDLGVLRQELAKLAAAAPGAEVSVADVGALVGVRRGETVHDWVDAVLRRDAARAVELLDVVLRQGSVTGVQLIMTLGTGLVGVRMARGLADAGTGWTRLPGAVHDRIQAARPSGLRRGWRDEARRWAEAARAWTAEGLDRAIAAAAEADRRLKSTTISDERGILRTMLLTLAEPRAAA